jgi:hypothetical protein
MKNIGSGTALSVKNQYNFDIGEAWNAKPRMRTSPVEIRYEKRKDQI